MDSAPEKIGDATHSFFVRSFALYSTVKDCAAMSEVATRTINAVANATKCRSPQRVIVASLQMTPARAVHSTQLAYGRVCHV